MARSCGKQMTGFPLVAMFGLGILCSLTGCQVDVGGQTLPSGYYHYDDIQYFPTGPKFKLSREAAAMREFNEARANQLPAAQP
jgi:hypothetical protein